MEIHQLTSQFKIPGNLRVEQLAKEATITTTKDTVACICRNYIRKVVREETKKE